MHGERSSTKTAAGRAHGGRARKLACAASIALVALGVAPAARAEEPRPVDGTVLAEPHDESDDLAVLGLMVDAGVPDGAGASIVIRPWSWLRVHGGVTHNLVSQGIRGGITLVPLDLWLLKITLNAEGGMYFPGDANKVVKLVQKDADDITLLSRVGYEYANGHVGVELGGDTFCLYVHAGWSYLHARFADGSQDIGDGSIVFTGSPTVTAFVPSAKAGMMLFLF